MLIVTWNVNSLRVRMPRLIELLQKHQPDVVCLQETRCTIENFPHLEIQGAGYAAADHGLGGTSGVAILARHEAPPEDVRAGLPGEPIPEDGRWIEATVARVRIVSVYVINGRTVDDPMYKSKLQMLDAMTSQAAALAEAGEACIVGDFNIAPADEDVYDRAGFEGGTHVTEEERARLRAMLDAGYADAWHAAPERGEHEYTWWDYRAGNLHKNLGLRIDLGLVTPGIEKRLEWVGIDRDMRKGEKPSDHAPLLIRLAD